MMEPNLVSLSSSFGDVQGVTHATLRNPTSKTSLLGCLRRVGAKPHSGTPYHYIRIKPICDVYNNAAHQLHFDSYRKR